MKKQTDYRTPVIIICLVIAVIVGANVLLSQQTVPSSVESVPTVLDTLESQEQVAQNTESKRDYFTLQEKQKMFKQAPEIRGISGYINTENTVTLEKLRSEGKVVLVDFWTYSCINCQRTTPYLNSWHDKYADDGLVILGVHSPEFAFEKDFNNVKSAVEKFGIEYLVVQDNDFETWRAYDNRYWPRKYIVDIDGFIRYDHIGEGAYEQTEEVIKDLLMERSDRLGTKIEMDDSTAKPVVAQDVDFGKVNTPEIYFGYKFARQQLGNFEGFQPDRENNYTLPDPGKWLQNTPYLGGNWYGTPDSVDLKGGKGTVGLEYMAKSVNIVAGGKGKATVFLDGEKIDEVEIEESTLYNVVSSQSYGTHSLVLEFEGDVKMYTFTFG